MAKLIEMWFEGWGLTCIGPWSLPMRVTFSFVVKPYDHDNDTLKFWDFSFLYCFSSKPFLSETLEKMRAVGDFHWFDFPGTSSSISYLSIPSPMTSLDNPQKLPAPLHGDIDPDLTHGC